MHAPAPVGGPRLDLSLIRDHDLWAERLTRLFDQLGFAFGHAR
jgi:hypothetical protein